MTEHELTAAVDRLVDETCTAQGLPKRVADPAALAKVATLLKAPATEPASERAS